MRTIFISILALLAAIVISTAANKGTPAGNEAREKARYYYLEGLILQSSGNEPEAYEYFKRAYAIDPSYSEAASALGTLRLMVNVDTLQSKTELKRSLSMMKEFVEEYPAEYYEAQYYAYVAGKIDSVQEAIRVFERTDSLRPEKTTSLLHLADLYMASGNIDKAVDALSRFEKAEGLSPQITLKKAQFFISKGDTVGALNEITRLQESQPKDPSLLILKGNFFILAGKPDSAFVYYEKAERLDPENGAAKLSLANYYLEKNDSVNYDKKIYEALLAEDFGLQEKTEILSNYLQTLINDKSDTSRGDYLFSVLNEQYSHEPTLLDLSARYSAAKGDFSNAEEQISYAIDLNPNNEIYWRQLMGYQIAGENFKGAEKTYGKAEKHFNPISKELKMLYATAAQLGKDYPKAVEIYSSMIADKMPNIAPNDTLRESMLTNLSYEDLQELSSLYNMIGDVKYLEKDVPAAFLAYENSLVLFPNNPLTLNNYAYFLAENGGDLERAEKMSNEAVTQQPDNDTFLDTYAWIMFRKGDYKEALKYQENAIKAAEEHGGEVSSELYEHYGDILFMNKEPEKAVEFWKKALELDPEKDILKKKVSHKTYFYD